MTTRTSSNVIRDVEPHIPEIPTLWTEIAKRVDCWAPASIKTALDELAKRGTVAKIELTDQRGFKRHLYSRAVP